MLKHLIILLSDASVAYCNYDVPCKNIEDAIWISEDNLKKGILEGLKQNMIIQIVYPIQSMPERLQELVNSTNHVSITPFGSTLKGDIHIAESWDSISEEKQYGNLIIRTSLADLMDNTCTLLSILKNTLRVNIALSDAINITDNDAIEYGKWLDNLALKVSELFLKGFNPQLNILTDRLYLNEMRNCNAGVETITLAPDGHYYICPAFYHNGKSSVGCVNLGLNIPNKRLYELNNAPICNKCDSWHCRRCVWLNYTKTREVNTPGHIQCVISHLERKATSKLRNILTSYGMTLNFSDIPELEYLDPICKCL